MKCCNLIVSFRFLKTFLFAVTCATLALPSFAAERNPKLSNEAVARVKELNATIDDEAKGLGAEHWAGRYYHGDGLGVNVTVAMAPKGGFTFEWRACIRVYDRNYGSVTERGHSLVLSPVLPNEQEGFKGTPTEFIPVKWGERRYLIPADDVVGFCNQINSGREPRQYAHGFYLMRSGDEKKAVSGGPEFPPGVEQSLLNAPITAKIIEVGAVTSRDSRANWKFYDTKVTLDVGSKQGVVTGMTFHVISPQNVFETARITSVEENKSIATITQMGEKRSIPGVNWKLSTRMRGTVGKNASGPAVK